MKIERLILIGLLCLVGTVRAQMPACWPDVVWKPKVAQEDLPRGFNVKRVAFWTCATPTGYRNTWMVYNDSDIMPWLVKAVKGTFMKADADATCAKQCDLIYEDNLVAAVHKLQGKYLAYAIVSKNGDYTSRPVREIRADGTLGDVIASNVARAPVGAPCWLNTRVSGSWYSVEGQANVAVSDPEAKLGKVAAACTVTVPLGSNGG